MDSSYKVYELVAEITFPACHVASKIQVPVSINMKYSQTLVKSPGVRQGTDKPICLWWEEVGSWVI